jgi:alpha-amylase
MAVLMSNDGDGVKAMNTGVANMRYIDYTEHIKENVRTNEEGWGEFRCKAGSVSVWIPASNSVRS